MGMLRGRTARVLRRAILDAARLSIAESVRRVYHLQSTESRGTRAVMRVSSQPSRVASTAATGNTNWMGRDLALFVD